MLTVPQLARILSLSEPVPLLFSERPFYDQERYVRLARAALCAMKNTVILALDCKNEMGCAVPTPCCPACHKDGTCTQETLRDNSTLPLCCAASDWLERHDLLARDFLLQEIKK